MTEIIGPSCNNDPDLFRRMLDEYYDWPSPYTFKFIVPSVHLDELRLLLRGHDLKTRASSKGKYVSVSLSPVVDSSDAVLQLYSKVSRVEGLVAL